MTERTTVRGRPTAQYSYVGIRDSLPTASADFKDQLTIVRGGSGVADKLYVCHKQDAGTFTWTELTREDNATFIDNLTVEDNLFVGTVRVGAQQVETADLFSNTVRQVTDTLADVETVNLVLPNNGATYDITCRVHMRASVDVEPGFVVAFARIGADGSVQGTRTGTVAGERSILAVARQKGTVGSGQTIICRARAQVSGGDDGSVQATVIDVEAIPRL